MNASHRLMCESWVEKRPEINYVTPHEASSRRNSLKWKTRYAMLIVSCETRTSEIRFYQKKPRSYTEITDDIVKLQPWQYIVDVPSWIVDKGRPHVLRLRFLPESAVPGQHFRIQIAYQSSEETTAWMRCIQNQTKLTSGIQGHSFGVVAEESSATARIGVAGKHCLLFVGPEKVILANKTDRSVVCVWPFQTVRSYACDDDRRLVIEAGRCAPLGEGVYSFRTRENDDNVLFDLFDHYVAQVAEQLEKPKKVKKERLEVAPLDQSKSAPPVMPSVEQPKKTRKAEEQKACVNDRGSPDVVMEGAPPAKPPLPEDRVPLINSQAQVLESSFRQVAGGVEAQTTSSPTKEPMPKKKNKASPDRKKKKWPKKTNDAATKGGKNRDSVSKGIYDLDKLLYSLESSIRHSQSNLSERESVGYASPTSKQFIAGCENVAETFPQNPELAYAINTIKAGEVNASSEGFGVESFAVTGDSAGPHGLACDMPNAMPHHDYKNVQAEAIVKYVKKPELENDALRNGTDDEVKPPKPLVAPKPAAIKIPDIKQSRENSTEFLVNLEKSVGPPYAKVNTGSKRTEV